MGVDLVGDGVERLGRMATACEVGAAARGDSDKPGAAVFLVGEARCVRRVREERFLKGVLGVEAAA